MRVILQYIYHYLWLKSHLSFVVTKPTHFILLTDRHNSVLKLSDKTDKRQKLKKIVFLPWLEKLFEKN